MNIDLAKAIAAVNTNPTYLSYSELANFSGELVDHGFEDYRISILRNFIVEPFIPVIKGEAIRLGFDPNIYIADFDTIPASVFDSTSKLYRHKPDLIIIALWHEDFLKNLVSKFTTLSVDEVDFELNQAIETIRNWLSAIRRNSSAPILINNCPIQFINTFGILDYQSGKYQTETLLNWNRLLLKMSGVFSDVYWINTLGLFANIGYEAAVNQRNWEIARAPISKHALVPLGLEYGKFIRALRGKSRKCLVLDCDNTLWGGVIGEDGLNGIKLGGIYPGSSFVSFQQECVNLYNRGVILAICSKNNEADVLEVLKNHPDSLLKEHHFSTWQINWDDKVTNLMRIAETLNIGLDSLVFVDDNLFECDWVRSQLPQVEVIHLEKEPYRYRNSLLERGLFDSLTFSSEDKKRTEMYISDLNRKKLQENAASLEEYLHNLDLVAEVGVPDPISIPRVAQLTQKTNQFNLTTVRYTEGDINRFLTSDDFDVIYLRLADRVAELGIVGVVILRYAGDVAEIDSLMMSCRALGRGAEDVLMATIYKRAKLRGCKKVVGIYKESNKNQQVKDFYLNRQYKLIEELSHEQKWCLQLEDQFIVPCPTWITVRESNFKG